MNYRKKDCCEEYLEVDINKILQFRRNRHKYDTETLIKIKQKMIDKGFVEVDFRQGEQPFTIKIPLEYNFTAWNSVRLWFKCPYCGRRVSKLYMRNNIKLACRKCHNLTYYSRQHHNCTDEEIYKIKSEIVKLERKLKQKLTSTKEVDIKIRLNVLKKRLLYAFERVF